VRDGLSRSVSSCTLPCVQPIASEVDTVVTERQFVLKLAILLNS